MATINRRDGVVIAWGGQVEGPVEERNVCGVAIGSLSFQAELGVGDAELHQMIVHIPGSLLSEFGVSNTPERDDLARRCVSEYVEQHCTHKWVPGREEHFTLNSDDIRRLKQLVLQQRTSKPILCTVRLPRVDQGEPEYRTIRVNSVDNAIIKLRTRMNADPQYDWESARVIEREEDPLNTQT